MRARKGGLADLKRLRQAAEQEQLRPAPKKAPTDPVSPSEQPVSRTPPVAAPSTAKARPPAQELTLFARLMRQAQPIKPQGRLHLPPVPVAPADVLEQRRQAAAGASTPALSQVSDLFSPGLSALDDSQHIRTGHGPDVLKKLKRGQWPIGASLDLHGATLDDARARLEQFLRSCLDHEIKCVRIVHGKGYGSRNGAPVLKETVRRWLTQMECVVAYTECNEQDGGAGAIQALLKTGK